MMYICVHIYTCMYVYTFMYTWFLELGVTCMCVFLSLSWVHMGQQVGTEATIWEQTLEQHCESLPSHCHNPHTVTTLTLSQPSHCHNPEHIITVTQHTSSASHHIQLYCQHSRPHTTHQLRLHCNPHKRPLHYMYALHHTHTHTGNLQLSIASSTRATPPTNGEQTTNTTDDLCTQGQETAPQRS